MPGCVLRASGEFFDVEAFLMESSLEPCHVFRRGDPGFPVSRRTLSNSGFNVPVSDEEDAIKAQVPDALAFLAAHRPELQRLVSLLGLEGVVLDFGSTFRDVAVQSERFPAELVREAGALGIALEVSIYLPSDDEDASAR